MDESKKLVSCIMPTCNRRAFVPYAINYFLEQDYDHKELVIVDDGTDSIEDLVPVSDQVRYIRIKKFMTLGEKRNFCIRESRGDLIMHWDDDDWMAPNRISYQVGELLKNEAEVCGLQKMLYYELSTGDCWLYQYPPNAKPWLAGNSLLYTRDFWRMSPFPNRQVASDTQFIFSRKLSKYVVLPNHQFYVATVHSKNTSPKQTRSSLWKPVKLEEIFKITGKQWPPEFGGGSNVKSKTTVSGIRVENGSMPKYSVSACLLSYKRPGNIQKIVDSLHGYSFITEIIIWNNDVGCRLTIKGQKVRVINSSENFICYGRFLCAKEAENGLVYFQDDDAIVENVKELYQTFLKDSSRMTYGLSPQHFSNREKYVFNGGQVALLGWGSFIKKEWLRVLDKYLEASGDVNDFVFRREADKIFSLLLARNHHPLLAKLQPLAFGSTRGISLYLENDHQLFIALAIRKALMHTRMKERPASPVTWNIVITCRDYGKFLGECVLSVLHNQADYIITIVDDASTDDTQRIGTGLKEKYSFIHYLRNEVAMGVGYARNQGLAATESEYAVLLDADDKIGPDYLIEAERLLRKGYDVANPDAILFGEKKARWCVPETVTLQMQLARNHVHCCAAFRRSLWVEAGGIDEQMQNWQDYEFWIRLSAYGARIKKLPGDHFFYRKHGFSKSSESQLKRDSLKDFIRKKHQKIFELNGV